MSIDLDDIQAATGNLYHLLEVLYEQVTDIQYVLPSGERDPSADRVAALSILARDEAERIDQAVGSVIDSVIAARKAVAP